MLIGVCAYMVFFKRPMKNVIGNFKHNTRISELAGGSSKLGRSFGLNNVGVGNASCRARDDHVAVFLKTIRPIDLSFDSIYNNV